MQNRIDPKVIIRCWTFNHEPYIRQCLDGFVMQQTEFPFAAIIVDDASTDGEQEILWDFINKELNPISIQKEETDDYTNIVATHKINQNCIFVLFLLKYNHYKIKKNKKVYLKKWEDKTKYIAICEGDDYWTDPHKLQKQVDIMESHSNCSMVICNGFSEKYGDLNQILMNPIRMAESGFVSTPDIFLEKFGLIPTASMCYRKELYLSMPSYMKNAPVGDRPIRMWCAINGDIYYLTTPMLVHRKFTPGSFGVRSNNNKDLARSVYERMITFFDEFDKGTNYEFHSDVQYMKEREEMGYLTKIKDRKAILRCKFFRRYPLKRQIKMYLETYAPFCLKILKFLKSKLYK